MTNTPTCPPARRDEAPAASLAYVDHPILHEPDPEEAVRTVERRARETAPPRDPGGGAGLPGHLRALCRRPLFTREGERAAFLRFNWERMQAAGIAGRSHDDAELREALGRVTTARNAIVLANTRLVVALAKSFVAPGVTFDDLLAEGLPVLIRAVELFDVSRGNRFSTYATWAVRNHFLRVRRRAARHRERFRTGFDDELLDGNDRHTEEVDLRDESPEVRRVVEFLGTLDEREQVILRARFGLDGPPGSYREIGHRVGLGKERVRQLTLRALERLREQVIA